MINGSAARTDGVLIMARGDSLRMGKPKGLVKLPGDKLTFLERILGLYRNFGWPVFLIIKPGDASVYHSLLSQYPHLTCLHEEGGQDTAHTVLAGWHKIPQELSCLWVHPVDMPLIAPETIEILHGESKVNPSKILRPMFEKQPGHPVLMPASCLDALHKNHTNPAWPSGPVRIMVKDAVTKKLIDPVLEIDVADPAVIRDFDSVDDFKKGI